MSDNGQNGNGMCGSIITWAIRGAFVSRDAFGDVLEKHGLKVHIAKTQPRTFLRRAINECLKEGIVRRVDESASEVCYAIVDEQGDLGNRKWEGHQRIAVTLDKKTGAVSFTRDSSLAESIKTAIGDNEAGLISYEIGMVIRDVLLHHADATRMRGQGGVYFVPEYKRPVLGILDALLAEIKPHGSELRMFQLDVVKNTRSAEDTTAMLKSTLEAEVDKIVGYCRELVKTKESRASTFEKRTKDVAGMIAKATRYQQLLKTELGDTFQRLQGAKKALSTMYARKALEARVGK